MWLNDDKISPKYIENSLIIEKNSDAVSVMSLWELVYSEKKTKKIIPARS